MDYEPIPGTGISDFPSSDLQRFHRFGPNAVNVSVQFLDPLRKCVVIHVGFRFFQACATFWAIDGFPAHGFETAFFDRIRLLQDDGCAVPEEASQRSLSRLEPFGSNPGDDDSGHTLGLAVAKEELQGGDTRALSFGRGIVRPIQTLCRHLISSKSPMYSTLG